MIRDLTIEYRKNPIGIDEKPRFSWKLESEKQDVVQTSYQIQVVSGGQLMWDSGRVESDQSVLVPYKGSWYRPSEERLCWAPTRSQSLCLQTRIRFSLTVPQQL